MRRSLRRSKMTIDQNEFEKMEEPILPARESLASTLAERDRARQLMAAGILELTSTQSLKMTRIRGGCEISTHEDGRLMGSIEIPDHALSDLWLMMASALH